ncbi:hypothetical protein PQR37_31020 [Paraburkholderia nemoris]|uniref:hypothetical protein n=1 Tax=Paraburkholderia nemoris TaxID=2793076 RepID=UPI00190AEAA6|nr:MULTISPECIES: hypothetical protein [Paraburkholderia]MBK3744639.1 hypothetical protein [Paraburkholderia aspalathi]MBK3785173.1 hypothetical protein [Paraburkholderia aspalathi]
MGEKFRFMFIAWWRQFLNKRRVTHPKCNDHVHWTLYTSFLLKVSFSLNRYYRPSAGYCRVARYERAKLRHVVRSSQLNRKHIDGMYGWRFYRRVLPVLVPANRATA